MNILRIGLVLFVSLLCSMGYGQSVERVEPPFWWTGMNNPNLQLMLYGKNIGDMEVELSQEGIIVAKVHRADNKNYLFVDLTIAENAAAGTYPIMLTDGKNKVTIDYTLNQREEGSAERVGSNASDAIYLITPDRYANGNPDNDEVRGLKEGHDRSLEYGRHGGDLQGISDHLDYIDDMGFTAIWLNPVLENDQDKWSYHGYATTDYYKVDRRFGSNEEYAALGKRAKDMGIGMIMDIIVNHCGSQHWWMEDPPFDDWINYQGQPYQETNHRKSTLLDPYTSSSDREIMTKGWFVPDMPDLNQRNPFMSTYLIQNSIWWIEYSHVSGIRQDTYSYPFREFMTAWTCAIMEEYPNFYIVGEEWVENPAIISYWQQGKVNQDGYTSCLPGLMDFPLCFALHKGLKEKESWGDGLIKLYQSITNDFLYADPSKLVIFPDNHDMSRIYTQLDEDYDLYKMAMAYTLTMRGIPQLYYGTEILMSNKGTESHGIIRSDFPGGWKGDKVSAKDNKGLTALQEEAKNYLSTLLNWRKSNKTVHNGKLMHFEPRNNVYVYFRYDDDGKVMVILNKNQEASTLDLSRFSDIIEGESKGRNVIDNRSIDISSGYLELLPKRPYVIEF